MSEIQRYHTVAIALHWAIAVLIISNLALGFYMGSTYATSLETSTRFATYQWHKTFGLLVLLLTLCRIVWRLTHKPPPLPATMPAWEKHAAALGHYGLYFFMLAVPFSGWVLVSASTLNIPTLLFNAFSWPHLPIKPWVEDLGSFARDVSELHETLALAMLCLLAIHIAAALRHSLWLKDGLMQRMLPNRIRS